MYSIYEVTTVDQLRYIGMTSNISKRMSDHKLRPHHGHVMESYRILDEVENKADALDIEWYWINVLEPELNMDKVGTTPPPRTFDFEYIKSEYNRVM